MPPRTATTARQRRLGAELRKMREAAGLNAREAAKLLGIDHTKISHVETARFGVSPDRIRMLAAGYGCTDATYIDALVAMATERGKGWWEEYRGILPDGFLDLTELESKATSLRSYQVTHLPGLLQTADYARSVFEFAFPRLSSEDVEARISHRLRRSRILRQPNGPEFTAIIHEAALRMRFGGRSPARRQLAHLLAMSEQGRCAIRVMPFETDGFAGSGQAVLYAGGTVPQLDTVHLDSAHGATFLSDAAELGAYRDLISAMEGTSLGERQSRDLIRDIANAL
ncbi:helix-turn-helix domain-containing protein [Streptomyces griseocarneus]|uniref:helix-turn-helix domain-containing protein n=1 Tax=Streptomyces griseocarneus TaxID=51201 RepID=UPI00167D36E1|nr:helix-turn-helix transcriptional regulator [Streptomyces griseocarneus]MBZ6477354.1 helix-turn-helix domain-containing protein [Streptomyces griseocarneus]GHG76013.1 transcriptional regulator [Streptomyces griseocarneus]